MRVRPDIPKRQYWMFVTAEAMSRFLPRRLCYWLVLRLADTYYRSDIRGRKAVRANLRRVTASLGQTLDDAALEAMVRRVFQGFSKYLIDFISFSHLTRAAADDLVEIEHPEQLERVKRMGRGALLVTAHLGNWELAGAALVARGYPITAVAQRQGQKKLDNLFMSYRRKRGITVLPLSLTVVRQLLEVLKRGEFVALLADRDYTPRHQAVSFFGAPACLPRGPAWIASHYQVPILPGFMLRKPDDRFLLRLYPILNESGVESEEQLHLQLRDVLEDGIRRDPTQWFMFENLWDGNPYGSGYQ